ncbi:hypothetical protein ACMYYO_12835 [Dermacoccaceae bacterium W4C1]
MMSNGLILLLIVAIWAVYLLQQWVRHRENLATARSVDRFSESMRVLERRGSTPIPVLATRDDQDERRSVQPQISVKPSRPSLRAGASMNADQPIDRSQDKPRRVVTGGPERADHESAAPFSVGRRLLAAAGSITQQQIKAAALVVAAVGFVLTVVLTPFGITPWWSPLVMLVALAGVIAWLRSAAVKAAREGAKAPSASAQASPRTERPVSRPAQARPRAAVPTEHLQELSETAPAAHSGAGEEVAVFDVAAVMSEAQQTQHEESSVPAEMPATADDENGWAPVAVPRPTYTMKAKADRPEPEPAETTPTPERPTAAQYAQTAVEDLPFDGLALDEDLEELPPVHRAG